VAIDMPMDPMMGQMPPEQPQYVEPAQSFGAAKAKLIAMTEKVNIAEDLDEELLKKIGSRVVDDYEIDEESRKEWMERNKEAIKLANQVREEKSFPWQGAANVKLPLIADAAIKFAARAYAEIIRDDKVVKAEIIGPDDQAQTKELKARRVSGYMSWQLLKRMKEWEGDTDRLLHVLPVVGHLFRKTYYDPALKRSRTELVMPDKLCINNTAPSLQAARRATHILNNTHKNAVISNQRSGVWLDVDLDEIQTAQAEGEPETDKYYDFLEQHNYIDLDEDGYEEPYITTVERSTKKVVRIIARYEEKDIIESPKGEIQHIEPCPYFQDYGLIPSLDGTYYCIGFGALLAPLNETANTLFNQLLDAGTMSNLGAGFLSKEIKVKSGIYRFSPSEYKKTEATAEQLQKGVYPLPVREPSNVLFLLLGMVVDMTKDLASIKDVLAGDAPGMNTPATTVVALIEQGMKTLNAINKRLYRSMAGEFKILYDLNYRYMDDEEYFKVLDQDAKAFREDFNGKDCDVYPVADPSLSSDMQRMAKGQALMGFIGQPGVNARPIQKFVLEGLRIDDKLIEEILPEQDPNMNPDVMKLRHDAEMKTAEVQLKERELAVREREADLKAQETEAKIVQILSQAVKNFADAEAAEAGQQMDYYKTEVGNIIESIKLQQADRQQAMAERQAAQQSQQPQQPQAGAS
jgi:chaperonin GroES